MFICKISIIIILICQKLGSVGPIQQKIKLHSPNIVSHNHRRTQKCDFSCFGLEIPFLGKSSLKIHNF